MPENPKEYQRGHGQNQWKGMPLHLCYPMLLLKLKTDHFMQVLIGEYLISRPGEPKETHSYDPALLDMLMLITCPGKERTLEQYEVLLEKAELKLVSVSKSPITPYAVLEAIPIGATGA